MPFVCFIQAAKYDVADLFMPARLRALADNGHLRANEGALVLLPSELRVDVLKRRLLRLVISCSVDPVSAVLAFARFVENDRAAPDRVGWFLYDYKDAAIIPVSECQTNGLKRGLRDDSFSESFTPRWFHAM